MTAQLGLTFSPAYLGREAWRAQLDILKAAVRYLTAKEVASECDVGHTLLSDALDNRDRKVWHPHWTHIVKAMLQARHGDDVAADLLRQLSDLDLQVTPFALVDNEPISAEEEAAAYRGALKKFGPAGEAEIKRIAKRSRR